MSLIFRVVASSRAARQHLPATAKFSSHNQGPWLPISGLGCNCTYKVRNSSVFAHSDTTVIPKYHGSAARSPLNFRADASELPRRNYSSSKSVENVTGGENATEREVIYQGSLSMNIRLLKLFSVTTSFVGISLQPLLYNKVVTAGTVTAMTLPIFGIIAVTALITPPLLHLITKRYIIKVQYDAKNDKYIAFSYNLFGFLKSVEFTVDDITMPTVDGMFTNCLIKGKPSFLDAQHFTDQNHFIRIMGYDKPIDLQPDIKESSGKKDH